MTNLVNLADHRPPAHPRPSRLSRLTRLARWSDDTLCTLIVAAGLYSIALFPNHIIGLLVPGLPWYASIFTVGVPGVLIGIWATLSVSRLRRSAVPADCSMNVHVFTDEVATRCKCGATGDVNGGGAA